ncbi:MAG: 50S ribosome-binding GTPase [Candidatus Lokiarchaeota archaeon]|nr:50S ribosome-binding GTPase [Candidatus Lokiarchaeota archaeon]
MITKRVAFVGKPEVGKTTIKKVIFEGEDPNELVLFPLEATIGIKYSVHEFMDMKISLLDTPGQSLPILLQDEEKQIASFENTGAIIYIFDYPTWITDSQDIIDDIQTLYTINKKRDFGSKIVLFLHKVDLLIDKKIGSRLDLIGKQINKQLDLPEDFPIYFTSLHPNLIYTIYNAISDTFSNFSKDTSKLKEIVKKTIKNSSKTICFVSNKEGNLIIQSSSPDFDTTTLYYLYEKIYQSSKATEQPISNSKFINAGSKLLCMLIEDIGKFHPNFKNLLFFSETLGENNLNEFANEIEKDLGQIYI